MRPRSHNPFLATRDAPEELLYRSIEIDRSAINEKERTVSLSFSSETPVERWFGSEVLGHESGNVRMNRLENGAALLMDHDRKDQVGVVETATIDKDRKGRAVVRFSRSARGEEIFQDVKDGIRRLVSVGYRIHKQVTEKQSGGVEVVRVVDWEPYELSIVAIPADDTVGVGRGEVSPPAQSNSFHNNTMNRSAIIAALVAASIAYRDTMTDDELRALLPAQAPAAPPAATRSHEAPQTITIVREAPPVTEADLQRGIATERTRIGTINAIANQARAQGLTVDEHAAITAGHTPEMFREAVLNALCARTQAFTPGTPTRTEARDMSQFSLIRALGALAGGGALTGIELELHQEAQREARNQGLGMRGQLTLPTCWLNFSRRDLTATGGSNGDQGGVTVATQLGSFIDLLYAKMVLRGLGAQFLTGLVGNLDLPKMATGATPVKKTENEAATEASPTFTKVSLTPNRLPTFVEVSKQLLAQSSYSVEQMVRNDIATALALGMEAGAIYGGGTSEGLGILSTPSIGSVAGGTHGAAPTWANIVALETAVSVANADIGNLSYLTNSKVRGKLKSTAKVASTDSMMIWGEGAMPLNGYGAAVTNQVPSTLEKGSSGAVCSAIIFGNFSDLLIGQWGGIDIQVNPYIKDTEGLVRITAECYYDTAVRRAASFSAMLDALTT
jgi:HK97 family phage major capsid protein/HK97 family phage prohead protease